VYSDEVWTGIEYQVATHLIFEGLVAEGLEIVRAVRQRHNGVNRNPWNEAECGNHYARSMASWGLLLALSGVQYDGSARSLSFSPPSRSGFSGFFSTGTGWGRVEIVGERFTLHVDHGHLNLDHLLLRGEELIGEPISLLSGQSIRRPVSAA
jgi:hypothetical protein